MKSHKSAQSVKERKVDFCGSHSDFEAFPKCIIIHVNIEYFITSQSLVLVTWRHNEYFEDRATIACIYQIAAWYFIDERKVTIFTEIGVLRVRYVLFRVLFVDVKCAVHLANPGNNNNSCDPNWPASEVDDVKRNGAGQAERKTAFVLFPCQFDQVFTYGMVGLPAHLLQLSEHGRNCGASRQRGNPPAERSNPLPCALHAAFASRGSYGHAAQHGDGRATEDQDQNDGSEIRHRLIGALPKGLSRIHVYAPGSPGDPSRVHALGAIGIDGPPHETINRRAA